MRLSTIPRLASAALVLIALTPLAGAQVYKWTDDKGVVNYSNSPPADAKARKSMSVVEDRVSVYSTDPAVAQATQNARDRQAAPPPAPAVATIPPPPPPAPAVSTVDPCFNGYDPVACGHYEAAPVYGGRRRPPRLNQPVLPPGAIAGNVNQNSGFTPGLSTQAPLGAQPPAVTRRPPPPQTAPLREIPTNR
jgi:hypothetical protein